MMINVLVTAQYYENYNTSGEGAPYWKPKGGFNFMMPFESDALYYGENALVRAISILLKKQSNGGARFEYINHDIMWDTPRVVNGLDEAIVDAYKELELIHD